MPSVGRPWSRTGKSASRSNRVPAAPTRSCCERQPITTCTGDANRASRIAETEVGATASLRLTSNTGRRRCAPDGRRRPTRPPACLLTTATSGSAIGRGNRGSAAGRDHRNCAPQVLLAAISGRVIRGPRISTGDACQFGRRRDQLLIAAAAAGYEPEARMFRRATPVARGRWPARSAHASATHGARTQVMQRALA